MRMRVRVASLRNENVRIRSRDNDNNITLSRTQTGCLQTSHFPPKKRKLEGQKRAKKEITEGFSFECREAETN